MVRGRRYRGAIPEARTKEEAENALTKIRRDIYERKYDRTAKGYGSFVNYVNNIYLPWAKANKRSWSDDVLHARVICEFFAGQTFNDIDRKMVEKFKDQRANTITVRGTSRTPATVNRELEVLSKIFSLAIDDEIIESNPCRKVKKLRMDNQRTRHLSPAEEDRLMAALSGRRSHLKPLVTVAIYTGMRRGELLKLRRSHVDFGLNVINVKQTKTGKDRTVPMDVAVRETFVGLCEGLSDDDFVFMNSRTGVQLTDVKHGFKSACRDAGVLDLNFHDLRHTFGTRLADAGVDIVKIAELMGHQSILTTRRYTHATDEGKRAAIAQLASYRRENCHKFATRKMRLAKQPSASRVFA
jgi:integrase